MKPSLRTPHPETSALETLGLVALAALLLAGAALWIAGELSRRIFGGAWPGTNAAEMGSVLARFADHAADPAHA